MRFRRPRVSNAVALLLILLAGACIAAQLWSVRQYVMWTGEPRSKGDQQAAMVWRGRVKLMESSQQLFPPGLVRRPNREDDVHWWIWGWTRETAGPIESFEFPIWYGAALTGMPGLLLWLVPTGRRWRRRRAGRCERCGYTLDAELTRCPECGATRR